MTRQKKANPPECNPFVDGFLDWMDSPDGELSIEVMDTVFALLEKVDVDAKARQLIWADGKRLSIDESVQRIHADYSQFPAERIEGRLISWLEMGYAPENYSQQQLDELDRLTERWIKDHYRRRRRT
jgi:hypothetical protein